MTAWAVTGQSDMPSGLLPRTKEVKSGEKLENGCRTVASVMQGARLPLASSGASVRPVPREAESRRMGEEGLPLAAPVPHWRLAFFLPLQWVLCWAACFCQHFCR